MVAKRKRRTFPKVAPREDTVVNVVSEAWGIIEELTQEMADWQSNLEEKFSNTEKYSNVSDCVSTLEQGSEVDEPEPEHLKMVKVTITDLQPRAAAYSRADRLGHACYLLDQCAQALETAEEKEPWTDDQKGEAAAYREEIVELKDNVEGAEFPGMYG